MGGRRAWALGISAICAGLVARGAAASAPLRLSFSDAHSLAPTRDATTVREEIERLLSEADVPVQWSESIGAAAGAEALEVTIILSPSVPEGPGWRLDRSAMGAYLISGDSSAVFLFSPRIRAALGLPSAGQRMLRPRERRELARAVARVAVHELIHRLAPTLPHAASGVMQSRLDRRALTGGRLSIDETSRVALGRVVAVEMASRR